MLDIYLPGTGGMMPLPNRWLSCCAIRHNGNIFLFDCGEGTQVAYKKCGLTFKHISVLCLTHFHADHISGLPGLLLSMGNEGKTEPLIIFGPPGTQRVVNALRIIAPELPFTINFFEFDSRGGEAEFFGVKLKSFPVHHNVSCYGYTLCLSRIGKFCVEKAKALGLPVQHWGLLQKQGTTEYNGVVYTSDMVLTAPRKGLKITYCTDTRPCESISINAADSDLFICEGMYGENDKKEKAIEFRHMIFSEAAKLAATAKVKKLWLTHYSPSMPNPVEFISSATDIFPNTECSKDGYNTSLIFEETD